MKSSEIRQKFLEFFKVREHTIVPSGPLVPGDDPSLLFTNAGMVQFKDVFLGRDKRPYVRAVSAQRCIRAGGKHNDLENVGYTARHHTFFEMLGNFSFGDYFKRDAIRYAWEFLTETLKISQLKLWVTVYAEDNDAADIWLHEIGIDPTRLVRIASTDNFWQMGDTGPCGPCSEIFYDHGPGFSGGPPGSTEDDGDRFIEIWNLVFMQYNRDNTGTLHLLPRPSVDTGMGLERISAVMQDVHSNYETDLFLSLIHKAAKVTNITDLTENSLKVISDHIRASSFLITDGVIPDNEGRGYVLRRIIRRAIRHGYQLGQKQPFLNLLVDELVKIMGQAYPELAKAKKQIVLVLKQEEERFGETLAKGMQLFEAFANSEKQGITGKDAFTLYDTFGFPKDLTQDLCRERGISFSEKDFEKELLKQRDRSREASKFSMESGIEYNGSKTKFHGYDELKCEGQILAVYKEGSKINSIRADEKALIVLDHTPFYAESGGQVGDCGFLSCDNGVFVVQDTIKIQADVFGHRGYLKSGKLAVGDKVIAEVNQESRTRTECNHSVTHLMHKALREVLGSHVVQKGSLVDADKTRFDFAHNIPMTNEEIQQVEKIVNTEIFLNTKTDASIMKMEEARKTGAVMLFGEKYGEEVRVLKIGSSQELCGGTHVKRTGDIGLFKIRMQSSVAAGIRRVEAVTGEAALAYVQQNEKYLLGVIRELKAQPDEVVQKLSQINNNVRHLEKELSRLKSKLAGSQGDDLVNQARDIKGIKVLASVLDNVDTKSMRVLLDHLRDKLKTCIVVFGTGSVGKVSLIAGISEDLTAKIKAGDLINFVARQVGGKGGGRADFAQAGGTQPENLVKALDSVSGWVEQKL